jgi:hypothetical protein
MKKFEDILAENLNLSEEARGSIQEAWNARLNEAREELTAELREEFAQKFEHDKSVMIESMDKFLNDKVRGEMNEFAVDKKALVEERVKYKARAAEHIKTLERFVADNLAKEVKELREDRMKMSKNVHKLEDFVLKQLAEEVKEFHSDKKALAEQRVKLVQEGKRELVETKRKFVKKAAAVIEESINKALKTEIKAFRKDITEARENDFGRRMFEAFVSEYMTSHLNESGEVKKLSKEMKALASKLDEAKVELAKQKQLNEQAELRLRATKDRLTRQQKLTELMGPLGKKQRAVMEELLETVKTEKLEEGFKKYLPAVLNENTQTGRPTRKPLVEGASRPREQLSERTGDKRANAAQQQEDNEALAEIEQLRKMAGIK